MNPTEVWFGPVNIVFFLLIALVGVIVIGGIVYHLYTTSVFAFIFFNLIGLTVATIIAVYLNEGNRRLEDGSLQTPWQSIVFFFFLTVTFLALPLVRKVTIQDPKLSEIVRSQNLISIRIVGISFSIAWAWGAFIFLI